MAGNVVLLMRENIASALTFTENSGPSMRRAAMGKENACSLAQSELSRKRTYADSLVLDARTQIRKCQLAAMENDGEEQVEAAAIKARNAVRPLESAAASGLLPATGKESLFRYALEKGFDGKSLETLGEALALLLPLNEELFVEPCGRMDATICASNGAPVGYAIGKEITVPPSPSEFESLSGMFVRPGGSLGAVSMDFRIDFARKLLRVPSRGLASQARRLFCTAGLDFDAFLNWLRADLREEYGVGKKKLREQLADPNSYQFSIKSAPPSFDLSLFCEVRLKLSSALKVHFSLEMPSGKLALEMPNQKSLTNIEQQFRLHESDGTGIVF